MRLPVGLVLCILGCPARDVADAGFDTTDASSSYDTADAGVCLLPEAQRNWPCGALLELDGGVCMSFCGSGLTCQSPGTVLLGQPKEDVCHLACDPAAPACQDPEVCLPVNAHASRTLQLSGNAPVGCSSHDQCDQQNGFLCLEIDRAGVGVCAQEPHACGKAVDLAVLYRDGGTVLEGPYCNPGGLAFQPGGRTDRGGSFCAPVNGGLAHPAPVECVPVGLSASGVTSAGRCVARCSIAQATLVDGGVVPNREYDCPSGWSCDLSHSDIRVHASGTSSGWGLVIQPSIPCSGAGDCPGGAFCKGGSCAIAQGVCVLDGA